MNTLPEGCGAWLTAYVLVLNFIAILLMGLDKRRSRRGAWRIPERTLFLVAFLGGSPGAIFGMLFFRHKTRHLRFMLGLPMVLIVQAALLIWIIRK